MTEWEGYPIIVSGQNDSKGYTETYDTYTNLWTKRRFTKAIEKLSSFTIAKMGKERDFCLISIFILDKVIPEKDTVYFWWLRCSTSTRSLLYG